MSINLVNKINNCNLINKEYKKSRFAYNQQIHPLEKFSIAGIVWYQGESDSSVPEGKVYAEELCELIKIWRRDLRDENLPFVVIQIADYDERDDEGWHLVQEGQLKAEAMLPNVKTVMCPADAANAAFSIQARNVSGAPQASIHTSKPFPSVKSFVKSEITVHKSHYYQSFDLRF